MPPRHEQLAFHIASGKTVTAAAAREVGMSERAARAAAAKPEFRARVDELRREIIGAAVSEMASMLTAAIAKLRTLIDSKSETVSHSAIRTLLQSFPVFEDKLALHAKLVELEKLIEDKLSREKESP